MAKKKKNSRNKKIRENKIEPKKQNIEPEVAEPEVIEPEDIEFDLALSADKKPETVSDNSPEAEESELEAEKSTEEKGSKGRNIAEDKKKLKKTFLTITCVFLAFLFIAYGLPYIIQYFSNDEISYADWRFYEPDYNKNIYEDPEYMACGRAIHFTDINTEYILKKDNCADISPSAEFFYNYITCIIDGDYTSYPSYFTEEYRTNKNVTIPEKFTMQGLYDIHIKSHTDRHSELEANTEIYEVRYRIFHNDGTFRRDILPEETRTLVFELYVPSSGSIKINSIGYRTDAEE